jgi:hypothetical protein
MSTVSRGFRGRRRPSAQLPSGQYLVKDFPVLSAAPTPASTSPTGSWSSPAGPTSGGAETGTPSSFCPARPSPSTSTASPTGPSFRPPGRGPLATWTVQWPTRTPSDAKQTWDRRHRINAADPRRTAQLPRRSIPRRSSGGRRPNAQGDSRMTSVNWESLRRRSGINDGADSRFLSPIRALVWIAGISGLLVRGPLTARRPSPAPGSSGWARSRSPTPCWMSSIAWPTATTAAS